jgi:imidazolonepropionase-like amidohydrolase
MDQETFADPDRLVVIHGGPLFDGTGRPPLASGFVAIQSGRIVSAGEGADRPRGAHSLDVGGALIMPGLIDAHAHLIYAGLRGLDNIDRQSVETATINAVCNARAVLQAGYTSIRDVGTIANVAASVRDAVQAGKIEGPRIVASGSIICPTGGLGDTLPPHWSKRHGLGVCVDGVEDIRREVRRQIRDGVDNIKRAASGVEIGPYAWSWMTTMSEAEIAAAVEEAKRWGRTVAVHAQSYDSVKFALRAGVDTIEHGTRMDDEAIQLFKTSGAVLVPTLLTLFMVVDHGSSVPKQAEEMAINHPLWLDSLRRAHAAGIPIAAGADLGNRVPHGQNAKEIGYLVRAGLKPLEALKAATANAALALRRQDSIGRLAPGLEADVLVFDGDPVADVEALLDHGRIALVLKGGRPVAGRWRSAEGAG